MNQSDLSQLWSFSEGLDGARRDFLLSLAEFGLVAESIYSSSMVQSMLVVDKSLEHHHSTLIEKSTYVRFRENSAHGWGKWKSCDPEEKIQDR